MSPSTAPRLLRLIDEANAQATAMLTGSNPEYPEIALKQVNKLLLRAMEILEPEEKPS